MLVKQAGERLGGKLRPVLDRTAHRKGGKFQPSGPVRLVGIEDFRYTVALQCLSWGSYAKARVEAVRQLPTESFTAVEVLNRNEVSESLS